MGYSSLVKRNVRNAFSLIKDLATLVTLQEKNVTGFNFSDRTVVSVDGTPKSIKGVLLRKNLNKSLPELATASDMQFLFNAEDLPSPDIYDRIIMPNGDIWVVIPPYKNDGYTITVNVTKGL